MFSKCFKFIGGPPCYEGTRHAAILHHPISGQKPDAYFRGRVRQDEAVAPFPSVMATTHCLHIIFQSQIWRHSRFDQCQLMDNALILLESHGAILGGDFLPGCDPRFGAGHHQRLRSLFGFTRYSTTDRWAASTVLALRMAISASELPSGIDTRYTNAAPKWPSRKFSSFADM